MAFYEAFDQGTRGLHSHARRPGGTRVHRRASRHRRHQHDVGPTRRRAAAVGL